MGQIRTEYLCGICKYIDKAGQVGDDVKDRLAGSSGASALRINAGISTALTQSKIPLLLRLAV